MPISFSCSKCRRDYLVANDIAGRLVPCKSCGKPIRIPGTRLDAESEEPEVIEEPEIIEEPEEVRERPRRRKRRRRSIDFSAFVAPIMAVLVLGGLGVAALVFGPKLLMANRVAAYEREFDRRIEIRRKVRDAIAGVRDAAGASNAKSQIVACAGELRTTLKKVKSLDKSAPISKEEGRKLEQKMNKAKAEMKLDVSEFPGLRSLQPPAVADILDGLIAMAEVEVEMGVAGGRSGELASLRTLSSRLRTMPGR